jgi:hypothetical protein
MNKLIKKNISLLLIVAFTITACNKTKTPTLPPITNTGANTFGCKVNGVICSSNQYNPGGVFSDGIGIKYTGFGVTGVDSIMIFSVTTENPKYYFGFEFNFNKTKGIFYSKGGALYTSSIIDYTNKDAGTIVTGSNQYDTDSTHFATFNVTKYDADNKGIAGTFEMNVINDLGQILHISEGRFDIREP